MSNISELVSRTYEKLDGGNTAFWTTAEVINNGLNPAARLLAMHKLDMIIRRVALPIAIDQCFYDLRTSGTTDIVKLNRVVVGDDTTDPATPSQGKLYRLRPAKVIGLQTRGEWLLKRQPFPTNYWRYGLYWFGIYPRPTITHTITLVYSGIPAVMGTGVESSNTETDIPESWTSLLPEVAAALLILKEGASESSEAIRILSKVLSNEQVGILSKGLEKLQRKMRYEDRMMNNVSN